MMKLRENNEPLVSNKNNAILHITRSCPSTEDEETQSSTSTAPRRSSSSNKKMKHFHTIENENDENTNACDESTKASSAFAPAATAKPTVPRIRIRLGKKDSSFKQQQQQHPSSSTSNAFGLQVESLDSFSFEEDDDDDEEESIQLLNDDESSSSSSSSSDSAAEARDPSSVIIMSASSPKSHRKRVSFGMVQVQEYNLTLGDHPFSDSYPISLDWPHTDSKEYNLDLFERIRRGAAATNKTTTSSRSNKVACRHLSPAQRRSRLASISGIHPSDLARQEQQRHQQLVVEMEQSYYTSEMDIDSPYNESEPCGDPSLVSPPTPSHAAFAAASTARDLSVPFWEDDHAFDLEAFEPLELSRSKSVAEFDPMDCSILEYLCDDPNNNNAFHTRGRQNQRYEEEFECTECHQEGRRRKSSPW